MRAYNMIQQINPAEDSIDDRVQNLESQLEKLKSCAHDVVKIRFKLRSDNKKMYCNQCVRCGKQIGMWISYNNIQNIEAVQQFNDSLHEAYQETVKDFQKLLSERKLAHINSRALSEAESFNRKHIEALQSPYWHEMRQLVIARCNGICEGCGKRKVSEVHHLTYKNLGNEFLFELVGLCSQCHKRYHQKSEAV